MLKLLRQDSPFTGLPLSVCQVLIDTFEVRQREVNEIAKVLKRQQEDSNPGSLDGVRYVTEINSQLHASNRSCHLSTQHIKQYVDLYVDPSDKFDHIS